MAGGDIPQVRQTLLRLREALDAGSDPQRFGRAAEMATTTGSLAPRTLPLQPPDSVPREFHEKLLGVLAERQLLLASSIANADTPGYHARDIDFAEAAQQLRTQNLPPLPMQASASGHLRPMPAATVAGPQATPRYEVPQQAAVDGNTVDLDVTRTKFAENALRYEFSVDRAGSRYKRLQELFDNMK